MLQHLRTPIVFALGTLTAWLICLALSLFGSVALSPHRAAERAQFAFDTTVIHHPGYNIQDTADCFALETMMQRRGNDLLNLIDTRWVNVTSDACLEADALAKGPPYAVPIRPTYSYVMYPLGARHIDAALISVLSVKHAKDVMWLATYGSILFMLVAAWRRSGWLVVELLPVAFVLAFTFQQYLYNDNLAWSQPFSLGVAAMGLLILLPLTEWRRRIFFFAMLAAFIAFIDNFQGSIPAILSLTIVVNQLVYVASEWGSNWVTAIKQAVAVALCFFVGYFAVAVVRLTVLSVFVPHTWFAWWQELNGRSDGAVPGVGKVGLGDVFNELWAQRLRITDGHLGERTLVLGAFAWLCVVIYLLARRRISTEGLANLTGLLIASGGIFLWYALFQNHTYVHAWLMVRLLVLPAAYGVAAVILVAREETMKEGAEVRERLLALRWVAGGSVALAAAGWFAWTFGLFYFPMAPG